MKKAHLILLLITLSVIACKPRSNAEKEAEDIALERFDGNYKIGNDEYAKVYPMHLSFEVELQFFVEPVLFFFEKLDDNGDFIYYSDDKSMWFQMKPDHKTGVFHEINEESLPVVKE